jgi:predicted aconitase
VGAPFAGLDDIKTASKLLKKRKSKGVPDLWIFTQKDIKKEAKSRGYLKNIEESNTKLFYDCWFEDAPVELLDDYRIVTDSIRTISALSKRKGKIAHVKYLPTADCLVLASTGEVPQ